MAYRPFSLIPTITDNLFSDRFDRMDRLFSRLTGDAPLSDTPSYNLIQRDDTHYELTVSVPGFQESELDIAVQNTQLTISGKRETSSNDEQIKWLHRGISQSAFTLSFSLSNRIKVGSANLSNGLLQLSLEYEVPEEEKPQRIAISSGGREGNVLEHQQ
ncbi:Hsp20 family protein [Serratia sp. AKBS12]|uniref:Hsp20 family protein n=1 Tax=Serratia sp. AKBS12 TaxID=2974597 RepID=UPI00216540F2|nr:Hsp20 family protein [Serratia sp. AKBS12]MCS3408701.1 Hsp20 family protein [Serratia sp. AKBS12]HEI8865039.1 Hsp20 family protein [Serratia odorifera]HEI8869085.1 Hsp20 family protein [Serratia odorifera]